MGNACCGGRPPLEPETVGGSKFLLGMTAMLVKRSLKKREEFEDRGSAEKALKELEKLLVAALGKVEESEAECVGTSPSCVSLVESIKAKMREYKSIARRPDTDSESQELLPAQLQFFKSKKEEIRNTMKDLASALRDLSEYKTKSLLLQVVEPKVKSVKGLAIGLTKRIGFWKVQPRTTELEEIGSLEQEIDRITRKALACEAAVKRVVEAQYMSPLRGKIERYIEKLKWYEDLANKEVAAEKPIEKSPTSEREGSMGGEYDEFTRGAEHWPDSDDDDSPHEKEKEKTEKPSSDKDKEKKPISEPTKPKVEKGKETKTEVKPTSPKNRVDEASPVSKPFKPLVPNPVKALQSTSYPAPSSISSIKSIVRKATAEVKTPGNKTGISVFGTRVQAPPQASAVKIIAQVQKEEGKARIQIEEEKGTLGTKPSPVQLHLETMLISTVPELEIEGLYSQTREFTALQNGSLLRKLFNAHGTTYPHPADHETVFALFQHILSKKESEDVADLSNGNAPLPMDHTVVKFFYDEFRADALSRLIGFLHGLNLLLKQGQPQPQLIAKVLNIFVDQPLPSAIALAVPKVVSYLQEFGQTHRSEVAGGTLPLVGALDAIHRMFREHPVQGTEIIKRIKPEGLSLTEYMVFVMCYKIKSLQKEALFKFVSDGTDKVSLQNLKPRLREALELWISDEDLETTVTALDFTNMGFMNRVMFNKVFDLNRFSTQAKLPERSIPVYTFLAHFINVCLHQRNTMLLELGHIFHTVGNSATREQFIQFLQTIDSGHDLGTLVPARPEGAEYTFDDLVEVAEKWFIGPYDRMYFGNVHAVTKSLVGMRDPEVPNCVVELSASL